MTRLLIGSKLRERRKALGLSQAALAARVGISPSYLNLIEANRRNIGGVLLQALARELGVAVDQFDGAAQRQLLAQLSALREEAMLAPMALPAESAPELVSRHEPWARALVTLHRAWLERHEAVHALCDRLSRDPVLAGTLHDVLTHVTAVRSAAEILEGEGEGEGEGEALAPEQRRRFVAIVAGESRRLSEVASRLHGLFTPEGRGEAPRLPSDEIDDFLQARENHFPVLEDAAQALRDAAGLAGPADALAALAAWLRRSQGVRIEQSEGLPSGFDEASRTLRLAHEQPAATQRFLLAALALRLAAGAAIEAEVDAAPALDSALARSQARRALAAYGAAAVLMPYDDFHAAAAETRHDIDRLARRFGTSFEQVAHRLTTLRRPDRPGVRFGLVRCDPAGHISKRLSLPELPLPRHGAGCPLWVLYRAFRSPGSTVRQLARFPEASGRHLLVARAIDKPAAGFGMPERWFSIMLMCDALQADRLVYADGLDLASEAATQPLGRGCRACVREGCAARQEPSVIGESSRTPAAAAALD